ncbi:MAG TPA: IS481 family transposase [Thermoanaerobaculia bacterium]|nr:IS481 family transposase [Thermoanaerobaculia bacterium]
MDIHKNARSCPASRALLVERVLKQGVSMARATEAIGLSERRGRIWLKRYREESAAGLLDRSSRPQRVRRTAQRVERRIVRLRQAGLTCRLIAALVKRSLSTVARIVRRHALSRLHQQDQPPVIRYEKARPGELIHIDTKKLARIHGIGHRITGSPRRHQHRGVGYEVVHVCIDDHSRLSYVEILADEQIPSAVGFLTRAIAWFGAQGIAVERVMSDNGSAYRSKLFAATCRSIGVRHIRTRPYTPRTNGKAERLIQTLLREWAYRFPFRSSAQRQALLHDYLHFYNYHRSHRSLGELPPISRLGRNNVLTPDN